MHAQVAALGDERELPLALRVGISAGEATHDNDDWFGTPVIEAARLCAAGEPGTTLIADRAVAFTGGRLDGVVHSLGEMPLKGLPTSLATSRLEWVAVSKPIRITLAGSLTVSGPARTVTEDTFGGRRGRAAFALLVLRRSQPIAKDQLADAIWGDDVPSTWEPALRNAVTKVRAALADAGLTANEVLTAAFGCYQLALPQNTVIDVEEAAAGVEAAEAALGDEDPSRVRQLADAALGVLRLPLLPAEEGAWLEAARAHC